MPLCMRHPGLDTLGSHHENSILSNGSETPQLPYLSTHLFLGTWGNPRHKGQRWQERIRVILLSLASALGFCGGFYCTVLGLNSTLVLAHPENPVSEKVEIGFLHSLRAGHCQEHLHSHRASPAPAPAGRTQPLACIFCLLCQTQTWDSREVCPPDIPLYLCSGETRESSHPCWHQPSPERVC